MTRLTKLSRSLVDRVVLVTGAASGMGRATAHLLADEGAKVGIVDRSGDALKAVAEEIRGVGGTVHAVVADITDPEAPAAAVAEVRAALGPLDGLVNNAGVSIHVPLEDPGFAEAWATTLAVNLTAQALFARAAIPDLVRHGDGRMVNIASTEGLGATAGIAPYTSSKHGVIGLTRSLAVEYGRTGLTVNAVCPGPIRTAMTAGIPDDAKEVFARRRTALRRYAEPEEVAQITVSLLLPAASYITGAVIPVDGGLTIRNA
ncbi:SDR family NAD(P)-dependent oxidoreductase [Pseudonocardia sp. WMMC193]|uniref:SDR family NAD(P)-dependent oxidoreductase n=1 Tax=Pseudonocardia sp. WMMC193 TaxID=2911965 RepID=UPI001F2E2DB4|nr:SDR family NAD(P)-dependent oxidoreductase [Pseudonocardia sp. WMMC193]MCF7552416.1 SDR family oxidoreductase [Pseudonocardia sp. WMMC193]